MSFPFIMIPADTEQSASSQRAGNEARDTAHRATDAVIELEGALERLTLTCRAMWEVLQQGPGVTEDDLLAKVRELDLRDGRLDGKLSVAAKSCPGCRRVNRAKRTRCLYCGHEIQSASAFDAV